MSQWLPEQTAEPFAGTAHALPQPPQFAVFVARSTQLPEHAVSPPPQVNPHPSEEQDSPGAQALPHCPQLAGSTLVSTHEPLHCARPASQTNPQTFDVHTAVPNAGTLQATSHDPQ